MQCLIRIGFVKTKRRFIQKECKNKKNQSKNKLKSYISSFLCPDCFSPAIINDQNKIFTCIKKKKIFIKS